MALPSSALWEGRPMTENRLYVCYAIFVTGHVFYVAGGAHLG